MVPAGRSSICWLVTGPGGIVRVILAKNWWSLLIRGSAAIALGTTAILWRRVSLGALVQVFFSLALFDGMMALAGVTRAAEEHDRWAPLILEGVVGIAAAILTVTWPGAFTETTLIYIIAGWALLTGVFEVASSVLLRRRIQGEWLLALSGFASLFLCAFMAAAPLATPAEIAVRFGS
jgi:uncharacterized membrane protein HdeD (DUF308 family)